ncbi:TPA: M4 family metallopeptidase coccolysin [Enterococcus faecalis]|nr:M4 family metallopeptidase coccolysin [Enterococcus faecalis]HBM8961270.1 M4 family metallopeptidase coccolysin [Enterococcus faecalis]
MMKGNKILYILGTGIFVGSSCLFSSLFVAAEEQVYSESEVSTVLSKLEKEAISEAAAEQYTVVDRKEDAWGMKYLKLEKQTEGVTVDSDNVIIHLDKNGAVTSVTGNPVDQVVKIQSVDAIGEEGVKKIIASDNLENKDLVFLAIDKRVNNEGQLFYKVRVTSSPTGDPVSLVYKVNATDGTIMEKQDLTEHVGSEVTLKNSFQVTFNVPVEKSNTGIALHGTDNTGVYHAVVDGKNNYSIIQAPSLATLNQNAVDAYTHGKFVKTYYEDHFQRHSIDDRGMPILSVVDEQHPDAYDNAFWDGKAMRYGETSTPTGKTYASSLDVVGHEMTHGVTEHTAGLEYLGQSGALNESYSDLMGYIISGASNPEIGADTQSVDRKTGIRNLQTPSKHGQPETMAQYDDRARYKGTPYYDQGGVHYNSGIINRIGYTIIQNLGIEKAQTIFYSSLVNYLTPKAQFSDARDAMLAAAKVQYGDEAASVVSAAFNSAGIGAKEDIQVNQPSESVLVNE